MEAKVQVITPELAEQYLTKNTNNYRSMSNSVVNAYATDMKTGNWKFNGDSIKFNKSGILVDGQHRLAAIVKSGVPIQMMVITEIEDDIATFDIGKIRTANQIAKAKIFRVVPLTMPLLVQFLCCLLGTGKASPRSRKSLRSCLKNQRFGQTHIMLA